MRGRPAAPPSRFKMGQRVHVVGSWRYASVSAIIAKAKVTRYRLVGSEFLYFENDLEAAA